MKKNLLPRRWERVDHVQRLVLLSLAITLPGFILTWITTILGSWWYNQRAGPGRSSIRRTVFCPQDWEQILFCCMSEQVTDIPPINTKGFWSAISLHWVKLTLSHIRSVLQYCRGKILWWGVKRPERHWLIWVQNTPFISPHRHNSMFFYITVATSKGKRSRQRNPVTWFVSQLPHLQ